MGSINAIWVSGEEAAKAMRGAEEARRKLSVLLLMVDLCFAANGNGTTASQQEKMGETRANGGTIGKNTEQRKTKEKRIKTK